MRRIRSKITAITEVVGVFSLVTLGFKAILSSPLGAWESQVLDRHLVEYALVLAFPLLIMAVIWKEFESFGISLQDIRSQLKAAAIGFIPVLMISSTLHFIGWQRWGQALLVSSVEVGVLFLLAWLLQKKPTAVTMGALSTLVISRAAFALEIGSGEIILGLVYSLVFVSLGEEVLFRGYIQSRLNECFGHPFQFFGVSWGWGIIISSLLFGLWHLLIPLIPSQVSSDWPGSGDCGRFFWV